MSNLSAGRVNTKVLPAPGALSTLMRPPWSSTQLLGERQPEPGAFVLLERALADLLELLEDALLIRRAAIPGPVSCTRDLHLHRSAARHPTVTLPPSGLCKLHGIVITG